MQLIRNFDRFPFAVRQPSDRGWCIHASIEAVTRYHMPNSTVTQQHMVSEFERTKGLIDSIGLKSIREVLEQDSEFSWAETRYVEDFEFQGAFAELARFLEECVDKSEPPIISIPVRLPDETWDG